MPRFVPRERKHKVRNRKSRASHKNSTPHDSNVEVLVPSDDSRRENLRRELRESVKAQQPKISSAKQKRLDKYIVLTFSALPICRQLNDYRIIN